MDKYVFLISGKKQSGKNTIADYIVKRYKEGKLEGNVPVIMGFADELKNAVHNFFGVPLEWLFGTNEDKERLTNITWGDMPNTDKFFFETKNPILKEKLKVRDLLQQFGTGIMRHIDSEVWIRAFYNKIDKMQHKRVLCCDCRFPNELDFPSSRKKIKIRLNRNVFDDKHISETALDNYDKFDLVIDNKNLTLEETLNVVENKIVGPYLGVWRNVE